MAAKNVSSVRAASSASPKMAWQCSVAGRDHQLEIRSKKLRKGGSAIAPYCALVIQWSLGRWLAWLVLLLEFADQSSNTLISRRDQGELPCDTKCRSDIAEFL